jgi:hypothetical protein
METFLSRFRIPRGAAEIAGRATSEIQKSWSMSFVALVLRQSNVMVDARTTISSCQIPLN